MYLTESGRAIRRQSDFGTNNVMLPAPSGQICPDIRTACPDIRTACPDGLFRAVRAPLRSRSLVHRVRRFIARRRRLDTKKLSRRPSGPRCHVTCGPIVAADERRGGAKRVEVHRGGVKGAARHIADQRHPGIVVNATLQSPTMHSLRRWVVKWEPRVVYAGK